MIDLYDRGRAKYDWWLDWRGECVAVVAGGPSLKNQDLSVLKDRIHIVVVNESHQICPWAEILYSCDNSWWQLRQMEIRNFRGLKLGFDVVGLMDVRNIKIKKSRHDNWNNDMLFDEPGLIGSGGNSGFQLVNLVAQMGATGIGLIGMDMRLDGGIHWHGKHPSQLRNPDESVMREWRKNLDAVAFKMKGVGIDVVNCSPTSALENYPKVTINKMLERWRL